MTRYVLAVTGASGTPYALSLAKAMTANPEVELHLIVSRGALKVMEYETDIAPERLFELAHRRYTEDDIAAPPASGSWKHAGMIVCPCSMASLSAIASGFGHNLIHRAADVTMKERRPLILVVRETPFNRIHLENMLRADSAGATIMSASPGFYHRPATVEDLVRHFTGRVLDQLGLPHNLLVPWGETPQAPITDGGKQDDLHPDLARPRQLPDRHHQTYRAYRSLVRRQPVSQNRQRVHKKVRPDPAHP